MRLVWDGFRKSIIRLAPDPLRMEDVIEISKRDIASQKPSPVSPMPQGLLGTFQREDTKGLLLFLEGGRIVD